MARHTRRRTQNSHRRHNPSISVRGRDWYDIQRDIEKAGRIKDDEYVSQMYARWEQAEAQEARRRNPGKGRRMAGRKKKCRVCNKGIRRKGRETHVSCGDPYEDWAAERRRSHRQARRAKQRRARALPQMTDAEFEQWAQEERRAARKNPGRPKRRRRKATRASQPSRTRRSNCGSNRRKTRKSRR